MTAEGITLVTARTALASVKVGRPLAAVACSGPVTWWTARFPSAIVVCKGPDSRVSAKTPSAMVAAVT